MNKKGVELSINMIIVAILAIVTMVVALGFITGFLPEIFDSIPKIPDLTEPASPNNPITLNPKALSRTKATGMAIGFYNIESEDITSDTIPLIECVGLDELTANTAGLNIPVGESNKYEVIIKVPRDTPVDMYPCTVTIGNTQKSFTFEVI